MQVELIILNGLAVTFECDVVKQDRSIGINQDYIDEWRIVEVEGKPCRNPAHFYEHIKKAKETTYIDDELNERLY